MNQVVIALGMFDGVHLGHRELIQTAVAVARQNGDRSVVFTYENHPKELFCGSFDYVSTLQQRVLLFHELGIDKVDIVPFTIQLSGEAPRFFIQQLLTRYSNEISSIVCGYDYRFGKGAEGDQSTLTALGAEFGFNVIVIDPVLFEGKPCSSTRVRDAVRNGDMRRVCEMLQRPYIMSGTVVHNKSIGRTIGYPTANLVPDKQIIPRDGVYASALIYNHMIYPSVTNIGCNPTVGGKSRTIETHVLNAVLDLYGNHVSVLFFERLRDVIRFKSTAELSDQIERDVAEAQNIYRLHEKRVYKFTVL